ncbi:cation:proton antiporter [Nodosilinea nodulosa]|uniref:cation:proton antiporter domain-containing protein n=1 Tax=Nodosilinea nodulosa TaxID=416001 RepID=UPI001CED015B|nr:cation:proton antiporter [Nodosilinea nodulosa]
MSPNLTEINLALLTLSALVLLMGIFSNPMRARLWLSEPLIALAVGVLLSPAVTDWIRLSDFGDPFVILQETARLTLAIQIMGIALRLPRGYPFQHWRPLVVLLGVAMPLMALVSGLLVCWILGLPFWVGMLIGAIAAPTDPVVATAIVTGPLAQRLLPNQIRHTISVESGANDGLAYPLVLLPILLLNQPSHQALWHWLTRTILWEVGGAIVLGALIGYGAGRLAHWAEAHNTTHNRSFFSFTVALAVLVLAAVKLLHSDGILAVFVAGLVLNLMVGNDPIHEEYDVQQAIELLFALLVFLLLGLAIPWRQWVELGWPGLLLGLAILALRRLPVLLLLKRWVKPLHSWDDAFFMGWFGPIGVAALFYAMVALERTHLQSVWVVTSLLICASVVAFGFTDTPLTKRYGHHKQGQL